jgi:hypothetical protein
MEKTYEIEFDEQSKAVVAKVKITGTDQTGETMLDEAKDLFIKAQAFAKEMTFEKLR